MRRLCDGGGRTKTYYHNGGNNTTAVNNPFTYRGYYYDKDLGFYYLNSRYYDAKVCRFVNADNYLHRDINGNNSYCYCGNNSVTRVDETGNWWWFIGAAVGAVVGAVSKVVSNVVTGKNWNEGIVGAAVGGAVSGSIAATTGNLAAASFAGAAVESAVNELLSYTEISTNINAIEKKELTVENVQNSLETVATDTVVNGLVSLCASQISGKIIKMNSGWFKPQKLASCLFGTYARKAHLQTIIEGAFSSFSNVILPFDKLQENYQKPVAPVFP